MASASANGGFKECVRCGKAGALRCSRCKAVFYCSVACQRAHWQSGHRGQCKILSEQETINYISASDSATTTKSTAAASSSPVVASSASPQPVVQGAGRKNLRSSAGAQQQQLQPSEAELLGFEPLFPLSRVNQLITFRPPKERQGTGLRNVGNTCFMNSVLQCFVHTLPLQTFLMHGDHTKNCQLANAQFCALCALERHCKYELQLSDSFFPKEIFLNLQHFGEFRLFTQEDAHEFALGVLTGMHQSAVHNARITGQLKNPKQEETSIVHRLFGGHTLSLLKCNGCSNVITHREPFLDLNLELSHGASLEEALHVYSNIEHLNEDVGYKCEKCDKVVSAQKQLTIDESPNILVIQLKRFDVMHGGGKINKTVVFNEQLDLTKFMSFDKKGSGTDHIYELYAVIVHYGRTMFSGHYVAFVKSEGTWFLFDDEQVLEVNSAIVLKQNAYMLFYRKKFAASALSLSASAVAEPSVGTSAQQSPAPVTTTNALRRSNKKKRGGKRNKNKAVSATTKQEPNDGNGQQPETKTEQVLKEDVETTATATEQEKEGSDDKTIKKLPKYRVFYNEQEIDGDSFIKDLTVAVEAPALKSTANEISAILRKDGQLSLNFPLEYAPLSLCFPFEVETSSAKANYFNAAGTLLLTVPVRSLASTENNEEQTQEEQEERTLQVVLEEQKDKVSLEDFGVNTELELNLQPVADEKEEKEEKQQEAIDKAASEKQTKESEPLPFLNQQMYLKMMKEGTNKEEASYPQLYEDIKQYYFSLRRDPLRARQRLLFNEQSSTSSASSSALGGGETKKIGRNDMCPCGSQRKYKVCHGRV